MNQEQTTDTKAKADPAPVDRVVHTPGPWEVKGPTQNGHCLRIFAGDEYVGIIGGSDQPMRAIRANAKLIAAAPDLLTACLDAISKIEDCDDGKINFRRDFADRLKEAVAKVV